MNRAMSPIKITLIAAGALTVLFTVFALWLFFSVARTRSTLRDSYQVTIEAVASLNNDIAASDNKRTKFGALLELTKHYYRTFIQETTSVEDIRYMSNLRPLFELGIEGITDVTKGRRSFFWPYYKPALVDYRHFLFNFNTGSEYARLHQSLYKLENLNPLWQVTRLEMKLPDHAEGFTRNPMELVGVGELAIPFLKELNYE